MGLARTGSLVDDDVELTPAPAARPAYYGIDNIITACAELVTGGMGFVINFGNGSPGLVLRVARDHHRRLVPVRLRLQQRRRERVPDRERDQRGRTRHRDCHQRPRSSWSAARPTPISNWGGPGYFWLPTQDFSGLPLANFALQLGQHTARPHPVIRFPLVLTLLPQAVAVRGHQQGSPGPGTPLRSTEGAAGCPPPSRTQLPGPL